MVKPVPTRAILLFAAVTAFGFLFPESLVAQEFAVTRNAQEIKTAVIKSLKLLETTAAKTAESRSCFTCHGQALPVLAMAQAQQRGLTIDQENLNRQLKHTHDHLSEGRADYLQGKGQGGQVAKSGWMDR
jgi:hypothetical protein